MERHFNHMTYHPCCEEVATPCTASCNFHEDVITDAHQVRDSVRFRWLSTNHEEEVVEKGHDEDGDKTNEKHDHPRALTVTKHTQTKQSVWKNTNKQGEEEVTSPRKTNRWPLRSIYNTDSNKFVKSFLIFSTSHFLDWLIKSGERRKTSFSLL